MIPVLLGAILVALGVVIYLLLSKRSQDPTTVEWVKSTQTEMRMLQQNLTQLTQQSQQHVSQNIREQTRDIHERLSKATDVISALQKEAGAFAEVSRSMKELHEFLKSPKLRGNLGEQVLQDIITQMFPKQHFSLQHRFANGSIVDAAITTDAGILPIDSKFPLEHFQQMIQGETQAEREAAARAFARDVRRHIDDIATKYILPEEGTMDFALMYIPSETVYYEIASNEDLLAYARDRRVYPVSPTTFYAHLQTILLSYEGKRVESRAKEIFQLLRGIEKDYQKVEASVSLLGKHLTNAQSAFSSTTMTLGKLGRGVQNARMIESTTQEDVSLLPD